MTIGTGIFLAALALSGVGLFAITKDRWNWTIVLRRGALSVLCLVVVIALGYFVRAAIKNADQLKKSKEAQEQAVLLEKEQVLASNRQSAARECVAKDLPRMEGLVRLMRDAVNDKMSLENAQAKTDAVTNSVGRISASKDDIKDRVLKYKLSTECESPFYLNVEVRADESGTLQWFRVWAHNSPAGYTEGLHREFSNEFADLRYFLGPDSKQAALHPASQSVFARFVPDAPPAPPPKQPSASGNSAKRPLASGDPCGPDLSHDERLRLLAAFGPVRQTGEGAYESGDHKVRFYSSDRSLLFCK